MFILRVGKTQRAADAAVAADAVAAAAAAAAAKTGFALIITSVRLHGKVAAGGPKWPDLGSHDPDVFTRQKPHRVAWGAAPSNPMYFFPDEHIRKSPNWHLLPIRTLYRVFL